MFYKTTYLKLFYAAKVIKTACISECCLSAPTIQILAFKEKVALLMQHASRSNDL
jgi:hypothetical protein